MIIADRMESCIPHAAVSPTGKSFQAPDVEVEKNGGGGKEGEGWSESSDSLGSCDVR